MDDFDIIGKIIVDSSGAASLNQVNSSLDGMQSKTSALGNITKAFGDVAHYVWANLVLQGINTAMQALGNFARDVITKGEEAQKVQAQLGAVLKSTGGIAGVTAQQANQLAESMSRVTTYDDEAVLSMENILLTFTNIKSNIFPQTTQVVLDLATAMGEDLQSAAVQVGKALQDPERGVTALRRVGVNFNEEQQKTITNLVKTGHTAEAQAMILKELETEFGGSAKAAGQTFGGQLAILNNKLDNVKEGLFGLISTSPLLNKMFVLANEGLDGMVKFVGDLQQGVPVDKALGDLGVPAREAEKLAWWFGQVQRALQLIAKGDFKGLFKQLGFDFRFATQDIANAAKSIDWKKLSQDLAKGISSINWQELGKNFAEGAGNLGEAFVTVVSSIDWGALFTSIFRDAIGGTAAGIALAIIKAWQPAIQQMGITMGLLRQIIANKAAEIRADIANKAAEWVNTIRSKIGDFYSAGVQLIQGLADGIKSAVSNAISSVVTAVQNVVQAAQDAAGIQSPSKVFAKIGSQLMAGMAQGIGGGFDMPVNAIVKGMPRLAVASTGGSAQASSYVGGNTYNNRRHIGPVVNNFILNRASPSELQRALRRAG